MMFSTQYLLSNEKINVPYNGAVDRVADWYLWVGENLEHHKVEKDGSCFFFLGSGVHLDFPGCKESEFLKEAPMSLEGLFDFSDRIAGVFLILFFDGKEIHAFNDTSAVIKCFYHLSNNKIQAIGSSAKILSEFCDTTIDEAPEAISYYQNDFPKTGYISIGNKTRFEDVFQLLPNHTLNLNLGKIDRFFPRKPRVEISNDSAADKLKEFSDSIFKTLLKFYKISCSLTAGWDSRMVMALSYPYRSEIDYYTFVIDKYSKDHMDYWIPEKIAKRTNVKYQRIDNNLLPDSEELNDILNAYENLKFIDFKRALGGFSHFRKSKDHIVLTGAVGEICKNYYEDYKVDDGKSLALAGHQIYNDYTKDFFDKKYKELKEVQDKYGYDLRDIAHWEQNITNFAGQSNAYFLNVCKVFSPFNCRAVIDTILMVPRKNRDGHLHKFNKVYLKKYAPELLEFPVNPNNKITMIKLMKRLGLYKIYKRAASQLGV